MRTVMSSLDIDLRAVLVNDQDDLVTPDQDPTIYLYDPTYSEADILEEVESGTYTGLGPFTATEISTGYYSYVYSVPGSAQEGTWRDLWLSERDSAESHSIFEFEVVTAFEAILQQIGTNELIVVELSDTLADTDGVALEDTIVIQFSTRFDPLYASADLLRMEVGRWIDFIPDDTLHILIHWASKEADAIIPEVFRQRMSVGYYDWTLQVNLQEGTGIVNPTRQELMLDLARTKFVIYDAALRALRLPGAAEASNVTGAGQMKRLGDLMIQGPQAAGLGGSGLTQGMLDDLKRERDKWWRVVNSGGRIAPGQSYEVAMGVRGFMDPDRRNMGRQVEPMSPYDWRQPAAEHKERLPGRRKHRFMGRKGML